MKWYLDFGHGGKDSGALGKSATKESDTVLKIGMIVKDILEKHSENVITTRTNDTYYDLLYRTNKANNNNCDYFISLHMNASSNLAKGCETWVYSTNSKVYNLAKSLTSNLSNELNTPNRGVKVSNNFSVLKHSKMPALLVEIDFISNPEVESKLKGEDYINTIAKSIAFSLLQFIGKKYDNDLYKVVIGSFSNKEDAIHLKSKAIEKGFVDTFISN